EKDTTSMRRSKAANQQHEEMRQCRLRVENGRSIGSDTEERCASEIEDAGVAKLNIKPERRYRIKKHGNHQQQHEMVVVEKCCHSECGDDRTTSKRVLRIGKGGTNTIKHPEPGGSHDDSDASQEQRDDQDLLLGR